MLRFAYALGRIVGRFLAFLVFLCIALAVMLIISIVWAINSTVGLLLLALVLATLCYKSHREGQ